MLYAGLRDYQSKDMLELVQRYYRRRTDAFVAALRNALKPERPEPATPNLIANPGFEEGQGDQPAHWGTGFVHQGGKATRVKEAGGTGESSGRLETPGGEAYANLFQDVPVRAGDAYRVSGRVKVSGGCRATFAADLRTGDWPQTNYAVEYDIGGAVQGEHDWMTVTGYVVAALPRGGKEGDRVTLRLYCRQGGDRGLAWFDDTRMQSVRLEDAPVVSVTHLDGAYERIEREWLDRPLPAGQTPPPDAVEAVRHAAKRLGLRMPG